MMDFLNLIYDSMNTLFTSKKKMGEKNSEGKEL